MTAVVEKLPSLKRGYALQGGQVSDSDDINGVMKHTPRIDPDPVQQHCHTTPDDAGIRPAKRFCSENFRSAGIAPDPSISLAVSSDPSASAQADADLYPRTHLSGAGRRIADHHGESNLSGVPWPFVEGQGNWPSNRPIQFPNRTCDTISSSQLLMSQPRPDIVTHIPDLRPRPPPPHLTSSHLYSDPWLSRRVSVPDPADNSLRSSLGPACSAPSIAQPQVSQPTYPPIHIIEHTPSSVPQLSHHMAPYGLNQNTQIGRGLPRGQLEVTGTSESLAIVPAFDHSRRLYSPQGNPAGQGIRTVSLDSVMGLSGDHDQGWVMVQTYPSEVDMIHTRTPDRLACDQPELVARGASLSSPFRGPESTADALYHGDIFIPMVSAQTSRLPSVKQRKKRGQFSEADRQATSVTRGVGACVRCRAQRIRCSPTDPIDPAGPCSACANVSMTNKKTIHRIPCFRFKITAMVLHRAGGLNYTKRFTHAQVVDTGDYADSTILVVEMTQGLCRMPVNLRVRRFHPRKGDVINRRYIENGVSKEQELQPYCLADVEKTAKEFAKYIDDNALDGLEEAVKNSDDIVKQTFCMIARECRGLNDTGRGKKKKTQKQIEDDIELRRFLISAVRLWFAIRHETGSAWLCGSETLGSEASLPLDGKPAVPRMIVAQFDSIRHERIYKDLKLRVLRAIDGYIGSCNMNAWFTLYLASFLLLHQVSCSSSDRKRWADAYTAQTTPARDKTRYGPRDHPLTSLVEYIQEGAMNLLVHWQYFKRCNFMEVDWRFPSDSELHHLKPYQFKFMKTTVEMLKKREGSIPASPSEGCWEHELFWISHLFTSPPSNQKNWEPPEGFSRAKPSVGNA